MHTGKIIVALGLFLVLLCAPGLDLLAQGPRGGRGEAETFVPLVPVAKVPFLPPVIDGAAGGNEWAGALQLNMDSGKLSLLSDCTYLYLLIDVTQDTHEDAGDYFRVSFDVDGNRAVSPRVDVQFTTWSGPGGLCKQFYLSEHSWAGCSVPDSQMAEGFGATGNSRVAHRF
ncbi:MAG: hypothetical protein H5T69_05145, partial [Chloroflexi bacterium]|nr:hypothetical protein [Chloroflexota bacterium]